MVIMTFGYVRSEALSTLEAFCCKSYVRASYVVFFIYVVVIPIIWISERCMLEGPSVVFQETHALPSGVLSYVGYLVGEHRYPITHSNLSYSYEKNTKKCS